MKKLFFCPDCDLKFTAEGKLKKWQDKIFGPCRKWVAPCPLCKKEADEESLKGGRKRICSSCQGSCSGGSCRSC